MLAEISLRPDERRELAPAAYSSVEVRPRGALELSAGEYFFDRLVVHPNAEIRFAAGGHAVLNVRERIVVQGTWVSNAIDTPKVFYVGSESVSLAGFRGDFVAPGATVVLSERSQGFFFADTLRIRPHHQLVLGLQAFRAPEAGGFESDNADGSARPHAIGCSIGRGRSPAGSSRAFCFIVGGFVFASRLRRSVRRAR